MQFLYKTARSIHAETGIELDSQAMGKFAAEIEHDSTCTEDLVNFLEAMLYEQRTGKDRFEIDYCDDSDVAIAQACNDWAFWFVIRHRRDFDLVLPEIEEVFGKVEI